MNYKDRRMIIAPWQSHHWANFVAKRNYHIINRLPPNNYGAGASPYYFTKPIMIFRGSL